jgi:shikimate dehydrogenase
VPELSENLLVPNRFLKLGILGHPLSHTLSPLLHGELLRQAGLNGEYRPYDIAPEKLVETLRHFAENGGCGLNVTIPHKMAVIPLLGQVSENARLLGAVNTIVIGENGETLGENTDISGFIRSLPPSVQSALPQSHILLLGAGGSARAVLAGLIQLGTERITIMARQPSKADALKQDAQAMKKAYHSDTELHTGTFQRATDIIKPVQGLINTTPLGMWPQEENSPFDSDNLKSLLDSRGLQPFVYDLIYRPLHTQLLKQAETLGAQTFNGLDMLILQGFAAFELWSKKQVLIQLEPLRALLQANLRPNQNQATTNEAIA